MPKGEKSEIFFLISAQSHLTGLSSGLLMGATAGSKSREFSAEENGRKIALFHQYHFADFPKLIGLQLIKIDAGWLH
jgi:hypothetical protein